MAATFLQLAALSCTALSGGCFPATANVRMWVERDPPALASDEPADEAIDLPFGEERTISLAGSVNEVLSFTFAIQAHEATIPLPRIDASGFRGTGTSVDASAVEIFRMHPVPVSDWPGWHIRYIHPDDRDGAPLDVLVPLRASLGGTPRELTAGQTYYFWADLSIPDGTSPGFYSGAIQLSTNGRPVGELTVELEVWPIILPDKPAQGVLVELDHRQLFRKHLRRNGRPYCPATDHWEFDERADELDGLLTSTMRLLQEHRLTPVLHSLRPGIRVNPSGELAVDWGPYDRIAAPFIDGTAFVRRQPSRCWPLPIEAGFGTASDLGKESTDGHSATLRQYMRHCVDHFARRGWLDRAYAAAPLGSESITESASTAKLLAGMRSPGPHSVRILCELFPQDPRPSGWTQYPYESIQGLGGVEGVGGLGRLVDIWMPTAQFYDSEAMASVRAQGGTTWVAVDRPPFGGSVSVHAPAAITRRLVWELEVLQAELLYVGVANPWPTTTDSPTPADCIQTDSNTLIYPGTPYGLDEPVASVRLKRLRQSLTDACYGEALRVNGSTLWQDLSAMMVPLAGTGAYRTHFADGVPLVPAPDIDDFELARRIMAEELIRYRAEASGRVRANTSDASAGLRRLQSALGTAQLHIDGIRLERLETESGAVTTLSCAATIYNTSPTPLTGSLDLVGLGDDWVAVDTDDTARRIPPFRSRRWTLRRRSTSLILALPSSQHLTARFRSLDGRRVYESTWKLAYVVAPDGRIDSVDGDLSDWPVGTVNVMNDFEGITWDHTMAGIRRERTPGHKTTAFVLRDEAYLYIAINCATDGNPSTIESARGGISYDDLVPVGEDLVEILLDPLNAGTRSPEDLYHFVIKRSGPAVAGKGIPLDPPCGTRSGLPIDWQYAVREGDGRWTVEAKIPLDAFDVDTKTPSIWGINVTRFDRAAQEFSTWSGVRGNAYDPLALGNLLLP